MMFVLVALGFIGVGIFMVLHRSEKPEQQALEATIVDHVKRTTTSSSDEGPSTTTSTFPVYEYQLNGKTYRAAGNVGITIFSKSRMAIGNTEIVRVDPAKPNRVYTEADAKSMKSMGVILIVFGILAFVAAV